MNRRRVAFVLFALAAALSLAFGVVYLVKPTFMPYHEVAVGQQWSALPPAEQVLILALMRSVGGGFVCCAIALLVLLAGPFRAGAAWAAAAILAVGLSMALPAGYSVWLVATRTPASPPAAAVGASVVLLVAGFLLARSRAEPGPAR